MTEPGEPAGFSPEQRAELDGVRMNQPIGVHREEDLEALIGDDGNIGDQKRRVPPAPRDAHAAE